MEQTEAKLLLEQEAEKEISDALKKESFYLKIRTYIPSLVIAGFWIILGYLENLGMQSGIFTILNFFTGAINGLNGSLIGGTIGKALLLVCVNAFFREIIISDEEPENKWKMVLPSLKKGLLETIPMYKEVMQIMRLKQADCTTALAAGTAAGILIYPFITGNGSFTNSFVLIMLAVTLFRQLKDNSGLFMVVMHWILSHNEKISRNIADAAVTGISTGFAGSLVIAACGEIPGAGIVIRRILTYGIPAVLIAGCAAYYFKNNGHAKKEEA